jgi:hypothetical protein
VRWRVGGRATTVGVTARTAYRYVNDLGTAETLERAGSVAVRTEFGRIAVQAEQSATYRPYYEFTGIPAGQTPFGELPEFRPGEYTAERPMVAYDSSLGLTRQLGRHLWLQGGYHYRYNRIDAGSSLAAAEMQQQGHDGHVYVVRQLGRLTRMRVGYALRTLTTSDALRPPVRSHQIDVGMLHGQGFSLGRNMVLNLTGGPAMVDTAEGTRFVAMGEATLHRRFTRAWTAMVAVRRALVYAEGFPEPLLSTGGSATIDGAFGRRTRFHANYGIAQGDASLMAVPSDVETRSGIVSLRTQVSRHLVAFLEYVTFHQSVVQGLYAPSGPDGIWDRHDVRVGLTVVVPINSQRGVE